MWPAGVGASFAPLGVPAYRRCLIGSTATSCGFSAAMTTLYWSVLQNSHSSGQVGIVLAAVIVPSVLLAIPSGVAVDRFSPRSVVAFGQLLAIAAGVGGVLIPNLALFGLMAAGLGLLIGTAEVVWEVPNTVFIGRLVHRTLVPSAIGLLPIEIGIGRVVGGFVAGEAITLRGGEVAFLVSALFFVVGMALTFTLPSIPSAATESRQRTGLMESLRWTFSSRTAIVLIGAGFALGLLTYGYPALAPAISGQLLHGGAAGFGLLMGASGVGTIFAGLFTDLRGRAIGRGMVLASNLLISAGCLAGLGLSRHLVLSMILYGILAGELMAFSTTVAAVLQAMAPVHMRGRVLSTFYQVLWSLIPVSSAVVGAAGDRLSLGGILLSLGAVTAALGCVLLVAAIAGWVPRSTEGSFHVERPPLPI